MKTLLILSSSIFTFSLSAADQVATTANGDEVILHDNGTWSKPSSTNTSSKSTKFDFRKSNWGYSKEQIKASEAKQPKIEQDRFIAYEDRVANLDVLCAYIFTDNKLTRGKYVVTESHTNANDYLSDYNDLKSILTQKYGKPVEEDTIWGNSLYKSDPERWGMALKVGHLSKFVKWSTKNTKITIFLTGDNYKVDFSVEYMSKSLAKLDTKASEKAAKEGL